MVTLRPTHVVNRPSPAKRVALLLLVAAVLVLGAVLAALLLLPALAERAIHARLDGLADRLDASVEIGDVEVWFGRVVVDDLVIRRNVAALNTIDDRPLLTVPRVEVSFDVWSMLTGVEIDEIVLARPRAVSVRAPDGRSDLDPVLALVDRRLDGDSVEAVAGPSRRLPNLRVVDGSLELVDRLCVDCSDEPASGGPVTQFAARHRAPLSSVHRVDINAKFPGGGFGEGMRIRGRAQLAVDSEADERTVDFVAERTETDQDVTVSADISPPLAVDSLPGLSFVSGRLGGLSWSGHQIVLRDVEASMASQKLFTAASVRLEIGDWSSDPSKVVVRDVDIEDPEVDLAFAHGTNTVALLRKWSSHPPGASVVETARRLVGFERPAAVLGVAVGAGALMRIVRVAPKHVVVSGGVLRIHRGDLGASAFRIDPIDADLRHSLVDSKIVLRAGFVPGGGRQVKFDGTWWYGEDRVEFRSEFEQVPVADIVRHFGLERGAILKRGELSGALTVTRTSDRPWMIDGHLVAADISIDHPKVAPTPIEGLDFRVEGHASWAPKRGDLRVSKATFTLEDVATLEFDGGLLGWGHGDPQAPIDLGHVELHASMEPTSAQAIFDAVPLALKDRLTGMKFKGKVGFSFSADMDAAKIKKMKTRSRVHLKHFDIVAYSPQAYVPKLLDSFIYEGVQPETDYEYTIEADGPGWVRLGNVSPYVVKAILTNEDGSFYSHSGFSWRQIKSALQEDLEAGKYVRGASTVSMQLVKNIFLSRERTLSRKLQEALLVVAMESVVEVPKKRIMEIYLNIIEWGPKVYGIRSAARHYFGRRPSDLTLSESVFLISIIPGPRKYHSYYRRGEISESWWKRIQRLLWAMQDREHITPAEYQRAMADKPTFWYGDGFRPIEERRPRVPVIPILEP